MAAGVAGGVAELTVVPPVGGVLLGVAAAPLTEALFAAALLAEAPVAEALFTAAALLAAP